jgi:hypothetical protein
MRTAFPPCNGLAYRLNFRVKTAFMSNRLMWKISGLEV